MKTTSLGQQAESAVANYLKIRGFKIIVQNWRQPRCEIDLVASKDGVVYFVEVKYRGSSGQGDGFDYVTPAKLRQMEFAGKMWVSLESYEGDWRLAAAAVSGDAYQDIEWLEI